VQRPGRVKPQKHEAIHRHNGRCLLFKCDWTVFL
jgi:hypothetical protein